MAVVAVPVLIIAGVSLLRAALGTESVMEDGVTCSALFGPVLECVAAASDRRRKALPVISALLVVGERQLGWLWARKDQTCIR